MSDRGLHAPLSALCLWPRPPARPKPAPNPHPTRMTEASPQEAVGKCPPHDPLDASPAANTCWMWAKSGSCHGSAPMLLHTTEAKALKKPWGFGVASRSLARACANSVVRNCTVTLYLPSSNWSGSQSSCPTLPADGPQILNAPSNSGTTHTNIPPQYGLRF